MRSPQPAHGVRVLDEWIPLSDGILLSARIWLPDIAAEKPVSAVLEAVPYRKDDMTAHEDSARHSALAAAGFAAVRVDIRGSGDSGGVLLDEYTQQEQDDALEVIAWIAQQPWCTGSVGMLGYSWGGIAALQVAARRPPQLKAIVSAYSTDDRYGGDCHYSGGCVLGSDLLKWGTMMRAWAALPPDPRLVGDGWLASWLERLDAMRSLSVEWLSHQHRDAYWRHGSIAEDYAAIEAATLLVGGWADPYVGSALRMLDRLSCPRRAIIGPWGHTLPHHGVPGPSIDFLGECVRWFARWLDGADNGIESQPALVAYMPESRPPVEALTHAPGRWVSVPGIPAYSARMLVLTSGGGLAGAVAGAQGATSLRIVGDQACGEMAGVWCPNGFADELPGDQRSDDERSLTFDTEPLEAPLEVLGTPRVRLRLASSRPLALVAARLTDVAPDSSSTLLAWGQLNLTHARGHEQPQALVPGEALEATLELSACACRLAAGHRLRLALSPTHWPHAWPSPQPVELTLLVDGPSLLELPFLAGATDEPEAFAPPPLAEKMDAGAGAADERRRARESDTETGMHEIHDVERHVRSVPDGARIEVGCADDYEIVSDDALSAKVECTRSIELKHEDWSVRVEVDAELTCDAENFHLVENVAAYSGDERIFVREERRAIPRELV